MTENSTKAGRQCRGCDQLFTPHSTSQVYCSAGCRRSYYHSLPYYAQKLAKDKGKQCRHCGLHFTPDRIDQVFCGEECRRAYYDEHYFNRQNVTKTCPACGKEFTTTKPVLQIYCSPECREQHRRSVASGVASLTSSSLAQVFSGSG